jgi:hypothetical protein
VKNPARILLGTTAVLLLAIAAFPVGAFVGGRFLVDPGDGLAGAATVLVSGVAATFLALLASLLFVRRLPLASLRRLVWIAAAAALLAACWVVWRMDRAGAPSPASDPPALAPTAPPR